MKAFIVEAVRNNNYTWSVFTIQGQMNLVDFLALVETENGEYRILGTFNRMFAGLMSDIIVLYVKVPANSDIVQLFEIQASNEG